MKHFIIYILLSSTLFSAYSQVEKGNKIKYYHSVDIEYNICNIDPNYHGNDWGLSLHETHGILFNPHLMLGLDIGIQYANLNYCETKSQAFMFEGGINFRYFILKKYKWTPFLMTYWDFGVDIARNHPYHWSDNEFSFVNLAAETGLFLGCNYSFKPNKSIYAAAGMDFNSIGITPSLRIGVQF